MLKQGMLVPLVDSLPACEMLVAYGSGVFSQGQQSEDKSKLTDVLVVVDDAVAWHRANIEMNAAHYPFWLRGPERASKFQTFGGARMIFFPYVKLASLQCKYGVIGTADLIRDLTEWDALYCAGRLQKPVRLLKPPVSLDLRNALETNLSQAVGVAALLLAASRKPVLSETELFVQIARLSYDGDVRMAFAENPNKVTDIVTNNLEAFGALYRSHIDTLVKQGVLNWGKPVDLARVHVRFGVFVFCFVLIF
jgi:translocator assembly and maintenance protein 41